MNTSPIPATVLDKLRHIIRQVPDDKLSSGAFLRSDSIVIFACGAKPNPRNPSGRDRLLEYADRHLTQFRFLMAEDFFSCFRNEDNLDLLKLENELAQFSDCIVIILESPSAIAELGAFAANDRLAKIMLVVNDSKYKGNDSFITHGPLAKIEKYSKFKPVIHVSLQNILAAAGDIGRQLGKIERKYGSRIDLSDFEKFRNCPRKARILFILDLVTLFAPLSEIELIQLLKTIFGQYEYDVRMELGLLEALRLVKKNGDYFIRFAGDSKLFFRFQGLNVIRFRSDVINSYFKHSRARLEVLRKNIS
jgi:hypothetical protein